MNEIETHPCFAAKCSDYGRIHIPVAPKCNMQCNYCLRKYSCANESRPGVVAQVMEPEQAVEWYLKMKAKVPRLTVAGIAGPGDALANWPAVEKTLTLIRKADNDVLFCLSTNGLYLPKYAKNIAELGVDYVTVTVNAITSKTGAHIYSFINDAGKKYVGEEAAALLLSRQLEGLSLLHQYGVKVKINTVAIPGVNMQELPAIARRLALLGCKLHNILPMLPVEGTPFAHFSEPLVEEIAELRKICQQWLPQMLHCNRCRADAVGALVNPCCFTR